ncbi:response regulator transcription factor [Parvularcula flava]|nr:LytTR family DNA-binding domain-containing protein [Aquisalinus luteolus]NHK29661.1 response regulator transcription factor [Aquisalinus luteolus]
MSRNEKYRVLVVDDEKPARKRLGNLLEQHDAISEIVEAKNGVEAVSQIETNPPDIVFLDVQMPGVGGFDVIDTIGPEHMPLTIFVTAYDKFALKAFDASALDYLLKPFSDSRFETAMDKALDRLAEKSPQSLHQGQDSEVLELIARRQRPGELWNWLVIKTGGVTRFIMAEDIDWIEAAGVYVNIHSQGKEYLYRVGIGTILERLDPFQFVRIHRSSIVNVKSIKHLEKRSHGEFDVVLKDGTYLTLTRSYREAFENALGQSL